MLSIILAQVFILFKGIHPVFPTRNVYQLNQTVRYTQKIFQWNLRLMQIPSWPPILTVLYRYIYIPFCTQRPPNSILHTTKEIYYKSAMQCNRKTSQSCLDHELRWPQAGQTLLPFILPPFLCRIIILTNLIGVLQDLQLANACKVLSILESAGQMLLLLLLSPPLTDLKKNACNFHCASIMYFHIQSHQLSSQALH